MDMKFFELLLLFVIAVVVALQMQLQLIVFACLCQLFLLISENLFTKCNNNNKRNNNNNNNSRAIFGLNCAQIVFEKKTEGGNKSLRIFRRSLVWICSRKREGETERQTDSLADAFSQLQWKVRSVPCRRVLSLRRRQFWPHAKLQTPNPKLAPDQTDIYIQYIYLYIVYMVHAICIFIYL